MRSIVLPEMVSIIFADLSNLYQFFCHLNALTVNIFEGDNSDWYRENGTQSRQNGNENQRYRHLAAGSELLYVDFQKALRHHILVYDLK
jgi:hypothetical protein